MTRYVQIVLAALLVGLGLVAAYYADSVSVAVTSVSDLTRDPTDVAGVPWWTGAISRLMALGWVVAATAALLASRHARAGQRPRLLVLGGLCAVSALDDSFLLHEEVLPSLGLPENPFLVLYAVAGLALGIMWVRSHQWTLVDLAFFGGAVMLAVSIVVRCLLQPGDRGGHREAGRCGRLGLLRRLGAPGPLARTPPARANPLTCPGKPDIRSHARFPVVQGAKRASARPAQRSATPPTWCVEDVGGSVAPAGGPGGTRRFGIGSRDRGPVLGPASPRSACSVDGS